MSSQASRKSRSNLALLDILAVQLDHQLLLAIRMLNQISEDLSPFRPHFPWYE
jgi:hypothetical protein